MASDGTITTQWVNTVSPDLSLWFNVKLHFTHPWAPDCDRMEARLQSTLSSMKMPHSLGPGEWIQGGTTLLVQAGLNSYSLSDIAKFTSTYNAGGKVTPLVSWIPPQSLLLAPDVSIF